LSETHRYYSRLYAIDEQLDLPLGASRHQLLSAVEEHALARAGLMGRYGRM
jgi:phosphatidylethanolamine-binding protein (PEBP) family uncharacterized protein